MNSKQPPKTNVLVAWPYCNAEAQRSIIELGENARVLIDSGAFTAFKAKKTLLVSDYCQFLSALPFKPWRYFALDVIGDPAGTDRNYQTMLDRGFRPVPVFTRGASLDALDKLYETSDVVGLGGVAGADKSAYAWTRFVMHHVAGRKVHILGFTNLNWIKHLRPYSVDASSWKSAGRYKTAEVYRGFGRMERITAADIRAGKRPSSGAVTALRTLGYDAAHLAGQSAWVGMDGLHCAQVASTRSWVACSADMERNVGVRMFFASDGKADITRIKAARTALENMGHPAMQPYKHASD